MMRWNGFSRSVLFGAAAAAAFAPVALTLSPWLGVQWSLVVFAALAVPLYLTGLGDTRRRGVTAALFAMLGIAGVGVLGATPREALVAAAVVLGLARSGLAYPGPFVRSAVLESALLAGGLMVANVLVGSSTLSVVLAVWGFFLVQSFFFLVAGARPIAAPRRVDPFEEARDRAIAIMDEPVGLG